MTVRTRFAPSPTGYLHVGGVRTALFAWLYARKNQGKFILRIEDTDRERSTEASINAILKGMEWLGLNYDEGPFYQTARIPRYQEIINVLLEQGLAYRCDCTKERLETLRTEQMAAKQKPKYDGCCRNKNLPAAVESYVIRFKNPLEGHVSFIDQVYGAITVANQELDDLIIQRTDGMPTYNFAVVVDDWDMQITHVIRGDDHINNTPRQINLFKALNAPIPTFAHLPMILGEDGKRLSKRHGAVNVMAYKEQGYLPEAVLNYLVRLGWSHGDKEIFSIDDMITLFDLGQVSRGGSSFSVEKLNWLNHHYLRNKPLSNLSQQVVPFYLQAGIDVSSGPELETILPAFSERCKTLQEIVDKSRYLYEEEVVYDPQAVTKHWKPSILPVLQATYDRLLQVSEEGWSESTLHEAINDILAAFELKMPKLAQPLRVALTGSSMSPSIDTTLMWVGKKRAIKRLEVALEKIKCATA